jgi:hypothetical protein
VAVGAVNCFKQRNVCEAYGVNPNEEARMQSSGGVDFDYKLALVSPATGYYSEMKSGDKGTRISAVKAALEMLELGGKHVARLGTNGFKEVKVSGVSGVGGGRRAGVGQWAVGGER